MQVASSLDKEVQRHRYIFPAQVREPEVGGSGPITYSGVVAPEIGPGSRPTSPRGEIDIYSFPSNGAPSFHICNRITAILRATATRALMKLVLDITSSPHVRSLLSTLH